ncbi:DUF4345 domain-containing protein [Saxibacter everestensis]|uniref:DUF4345 domain-containing protein n=1 Tax=Saxibacter everestensis TaxID=2909229 RepID=A0ABY8QTN8_9MICO|nr:DUF4345 domain-containing protein [Brevibacteriaceae bacterium ZFBP1038]
MQQRALIIVLAVLGAVAVCSGLYGIILGPALAPGGSSTSSSVDSEYRFVNVFWLGAGAALWWSIFRLRERRDVTRTMLALAFIGGLARLLSVFVVGWPNPVFVASMVLELVVVPLILWWHARVVGVNETREPICASQRAAIPGGSSPTG